MSRFLFHSLSLTGHVNPISAVARAVAERGHDVAWAGSEAFLRPRIGPDATIYPTGTRLYRAGQQRDRGLTAAKFRWAGYVVPTTRFTVAAVEAAVDAYRPDVLAVDQHAVAGALVAHRHGLRWATLAPTTMELTRPYQSLPKVEGWIRGLLTAMWTEAGLPGTPPHDLRFSPHLVIAFTSPELAGCIPDVAFVGAAIAPRPDGAGFPWERLDPRRRQVLISAGTLALEVAHDFYTRAVEALRPLGDRLQGIVVAPAAALPDPPAHIVVVGQVPMLELLPRVDAVISHGGLNTVCEALAHAVPLVVAPIRGDQPINAAQVVAAGAGVRIRFIRASPAEIRTAVVAVLDDPAYRAAARRIRDSFRVAGGAAAAARHLERLAG